MSERAKTSYSCKWAERTVKVGVDANAKPNAIVLLKLVMNVVTLLAMTFVIAFIAPVARYVHQKWFVEC